MDIFLTELGRMSFQAALAVGAVYGIRLILGRMRLPGKYSCFLWVVPYLVMVLPWRIESPLGFWRKTPAEYIPVNMPDKRILMDGGAYLMPDYQEPMLWGHMTAYRNTAFSFTMVLLGIWLAGIAVLLIRSLVSCYVLQKRLVCSLHVKDNIYMVDDIDMPFVLGIRFPRIFLPSRMEKALLPYVIEHEKMHIRRRDPLLKSAAFLITCIHWFNPAAWAALHGLEQDMEMACDEGAVQSLGRERAQAYADALVRAAAEPEILGVTFLAFGEGSVKKRIKNILRNKKPLKLAGVFCAAAVLALGVGFLTEARELPQAQYIVEVMDKIFPERKAVSGEETAQAPEKFQTWHREGYKEVKLQAYVPESAKDTGYVTEGFWDPETMDMLAQQAMRELYDLTGMQIEECYYFAYDLGNFVFSLTKDDLEHGRNFYCRQFENGEIIQGIDLTSTRRVWYSPVDMLDPPEGYEQMSGAERAEWFVKHSGLYNGRETAKVFQPYDWDPDIWRIVMEDDTAYEVFLDPGAEIFSNIAGPYPDSNIRH